MLVGKKADQDLVMFDLATPNIEKSNSFILKSGKCAVSDLIKLQVIAQPVERNLNYRPFDINYEVVQVIDIPILPKLPGQIEAPSLDAYLHSQPSYRDTSCASPQAGSM